MTEIEVPDPDPEGGPGGAKGAAGAGSSAAEDAADGGEEEVKPYSNLFVPLVVVPAMIVMVLVLVFVMFGAIAGREASPRQNLATMLSGGANERTQAAFNLARQVGEDLGALTDEDPDTEPEWGIDQRMLGEVEAAWNATDTDDYQVRYVLAGLLDWLVGSEGEARTVTMLRQLPPEEDPDGHIRFFLIQSLGQLGDASAAPDVIRYLGSEDSGLAVVAAGSLQRLPCEATTTALRGALSAPDFLLRGQAAISLAVQGDPAGVDVLDELLDPAAYENDRQIERTRWTRAQHIRYARERALVALARLHRPADRERIQRLADEEEDAEVRAVALRLLDEWDDLVPASPETASASGARDALGLFPEGSGDESSADPSTDQDG